MFFKIYQFFCILKFSHAGSCSSPATNCLFYAIFANGCGWLGGKVYFSVR
jgi:hypothetical protein